VDLPQIIIKISYTRRIKVKKLKVVENESAWQRKFPYVDLRIPVHHYVLVYQKPCRIEIIVVRKKTPDHKILIINQLIPKEQKLHVSVKHIEPEHKDPESHFKVRFEVPVRYDHNYCGRGCKDAIDNVVEQTPPHYVVQVAFVLFVIIETLKTYDFWVFGEMRKWEKKLLQSKGSVLW
jgi:hypothetical protein